MEHVHDLTQLTDEELLAHSLGAPHAFEALIERHQKSFFRRAVAVLKDKDEAEDVVQETLIRIYRFAPNFKGESGTFKSWSITILMNVARTKYKKKTTQWARVASLSQEHYESLPMASNKDAIEAKDIIQRALVCVPEDVAHILTLAFIEGLPYREIAEREGVSVGAIKTRIHRAKKVLKNIVGDIRV